MRKDNMDVRIAASKMLPLIRKSDLPAYHPEFGKEHLYDMVRDIETFTVTGEKAHRWLGWIQGCICMGSGASLAELKLHNFAA